MVELLADEEADVEKTLDNRELKSSGNNFKG